MYVRPSDGDHSVHAQPHGLLLLACRRGSSLVWKGKVCVTVVLRRSLQLENKMDGSRMGRSIFIYKSILDWIRGKKKKKFISICGACIWNACFAKFLYKDVSFMNNTYKQNAESQKEDNVQKSLQQNGKLLM